MQSPSVSEQQSIQQDAPSSSLVSTSSSQRPCPTPLAPQTPVSRSPQSHGQRNTLSNMLANRPGNAPIPPSLQAKMTAVSAFSSQQIWLQYTAQMLNRGAAASAGSASFSIDSTAQALQRTHLNDSAHPLVHQSQSFPPPSPSPRGRGAPSSTPARRNRPGFKLSDIHGDVGGGAIAAGLGAGRPSLAEASRRTSSTFDTPFANFNKIVFVVHFLYRPNLDPDFMRQ